MIMTMIMFIDNNIDDYNNVDDDDGDNSNGVDINNDHDIVIIKSIMTLLYQ